MNIPRPFWPSARLWFALYREARRENTRLKAELREWQEKLLERRGMTPLGVVEAVSNPAKPAAFDLKPPFARAAAEWEEEDRKQILSPERKEEIAREARRLKAS